MYVGYVSLFVCVCVCVCVCVRVCVCVLVSLCVFIRETRRNAPQVNVVTMIGLSYSSPLNYMNAYLRFRYSLLAFLCKTKLLKVIKVVHALFILTS